MDAPHIPLHADDQQQLLDAIRVTKQRILEVNRVTQQSLVHRMAPVGRVDGACPMDKSRINVAALEDYMLICPHLAVGRRPTNDGAINTLRNTHNVRTIINVRGDDGPKTLWYTSCAAKLGINTIIHEPLENSKEHGGGHLDDARVVGVAQQVVLAMKQLRDDPSMGADAAGSCGQLPVVFVHGFAGNHAAVTVALIAWYYYVEDNTFVPLCALEQRYDEEIVKNYPECWFHREQIQRICNAERKSVYASLRRGGARVNRVRHSSGNMVRDDPKTQTILGMFTRDAKKKKRKINTPAV